MKLASDFRTLARDALRGRWGTAVIAGVLASLLGFSGTGGPEVKLHMGERGVDVGLDIANHQVFSSSRGIMPEWNGFLTGTAGYLIILALVMAAGFFILGSIIGLGYSRFNLELIDRQKEPEIGTMFTCFPHWKTAALARFLRTVYTIGWMLLLIVPGIMAAFSYAMTDFILAEHPDMDPNEAISRSKEMMYGNRWRLFCLGISFIGWDLLCVLTAGIGYLWLDPYKQAATAAFYREISGNVTP